MPATEATTLIEVRQAFEEEHSEALEMFTVGDKKTLVDWLEQGPGGLKNWDAEVIMLGLTENRNNFEKGISKDRALIAAKLISLNEGQGRPEDRDNIVNLLADRVGGDDKLNQICAEGFELLELANLYRFKNTDEIKTDLAPLVEEVVTAVLAERAKAAAEAKPILETAIPVPDWHLTEKQKTNTQERLGQLNKDEIGVIDDFAKTMLGLIPGELRDVDAEMLLQSLPDWRRRVNDINLPARQLVGVVNVLIEQLTTRFGFKGTEQTIRLAVGSHVVNLFKLLKLPKADNLKERIKAIDSDALKFAELTDVIRLRMGEYEAEFAEKRKLANEKRKIDEALISRAESLDLKLGEPAADGKQPVVGEGVLALLEAIRANETVMRQLADEAIIAQGDGDPIGKIGVNLFRSNQRASSFEYMSLKEAKQEPLFAFETMVGIRENILPDGYVLVKSGRQYMLSKDGKSITSLYSGSSDRGTIFFEWAKDASIEEAFEAMRVIGQGFNLMLNNGKEFPILQLVLPALPPDQEIKGQVKAKPGPEPALKSETPKAFSPQEALELVRAHGGALPAETLRKAQGLLGEEMALAFCAAIVAEYAEPDVSLGHKIIGESIGRARKEALNVAVSKLVSFAIPEEAFRAAVETDHPESPQEFKDAAQVYHLVVRLLSSNSSIAIIDENLPQTVNTLLHNDAPGAIFTKTNLINRVRELVDRARQVEKVMSEGPGNEFSLEEIQQLLRKGEVLDFSSQGEILKYFETSGDNLADAFLAAAALEIAQPGSGKVDFALRQKFGQPARSAFEAVAGAFGRGLVDLKPQLEAIEGQQQAVSDVNIFHLYALQYLLAARELQKDRDGEKRAERIIEDLEKVKGYLSPWKLEAETVKNAVVEFVVQVRAVQAELAGEEEGAEVEEDAGTESVLLAELSDWLAGTDGSVTSAAPASETPDWLEALKKVQGGAKPASEAVELAAAVPAGPPKQRELESEKPGPLSVSTLTEIADAIKKDGVVEVAMAPALMTSMVRATINNIIQARFSKLNPNVTSIITIKDGISITGTISAFVGKEVFGRKVGKTFNIPVTLALGSKFQLDDFTVDSDLADKAEIERELQGVLIQLSNTFRVQLAEYKISGATLENPEIRGEQTYAKFRGKVTNK